MPDRLRPSRSALGARAAMRWRPAVRLRMGITGSMATTALLAPVYAGFAHFTAAAAVKAAVARRQRHAVAVVQAHGGKALSAARRFQQVVPASAMRAMPAL